MFTGSQVDRSSLQASVANLSLWSWCGCA